MSKTQNVDYKRQVRQLGKIQKKMSEIRKINPEVNISLNIPSPKIDEKTDAQIKLSALNYIIGYLARKGTDPDLPMNTLIQIAEDYEKRLNED